MKKIKVIITLVLSLSLCLFNVHISYATEEQNVIETNDNTETNQEFNEDTTQQEIGTESDQESDQETDQEIDQEIDEDTTQQDNNAEIDQEFDDETYLKSMMEQLDNMTIEELNLFIDSVYEQVTNEKLNSENELSSFTIEAIRLAWYAAALAAEELGYTCAATLVRYSLVNADYNETSGMFSEKIKTTSAYREWLRNTSSDSFEITKSDNADLFYALHLVKSKVVGSSSSGARILITDTFDFTLEANYSDFFTTVVNNWAYLCQHTYVLYEISVTIEFFA